LLSVMAIRIFLFPRVLSLYNQTAGGQILGKVISSDNSLAGGIVCEGSSLTEDSARSEVDKAVSKLQRAIELNANEAQSYLLLGQSYCLLGEYEISVDFLLNYTKLRAENPLGHLELGFAYEKNDEILSAAQELKRAGLTEDDFLQAGYQALKSSNYDEVLDWYARTVAVVGGEFDWFQNPKNESTHIVLESFLSSSAWRPCDWCKNTAGNYIAHDGIMEISNHNKPNMRDGFAIVSFPNVPIDQFKEVGLRLKADPGTLMIFEVVVDGKRSRLMNYMPLFDNWIIWEVPVEGVALNEILIGVGELETADEPKEFRLSLDWIALR
jgi:hypothetical protein